MDIISGLLGCIVGLIIGLLLGKRGSPNDKTQSSQADLVKLLQEQKGVAETRIEQGFYGSGSD